MPHVSRSVSIRRPRAEVYRFWRELQNLPAFMMHLESVQATGRARSRWVVKGPGKPVEWEAEIVEDQPDRKIGWRSLDGAEVPNSGTVTFTDAPADRGTEIHVDLDYEPPAGAAGSMIARWFGEEPDQQLRDDLRRLKQVLETGEVVLSEGSPRGAGEGALSERPSHAREAEVRS